MAREVSVVVPCHDAARTLPALLAALARQTLEPSLWEALLVDPDPGGAKRAAASRPAAWPKAADLRVVPGPAGSGPGAKRNIGVAEACAGLIAFTDADCVPEPGWLDAGLRAVRAGADLVQGRTLPPEGELWDPLRHQIAIETETGLYETSNLFVDRERFQAAGGFSDRYFERLGLPFGEDAELGARLRRAGARFAFEPSATVRHPSGSPSLRGHLRDRWLMRGFPQLIRDVPELRKRLWLGVFLTGETAAFAAAAAAALASRRNPAALALALPYARVLARSMPPRRAGARARARHAGIALAGDAVRAAALAAGSVRARRIVL